MKDPLKNKFKKSNLSSNFDIILQKYSFFFTNCFKRDSTIGTSLS